MVTPRQQMNPDATPDADKATALRRASAASRKRAAAEENESLAMRVAAAAGASTREIAAATGRPHVTVSRMLKRGPADDG